MRDFSFKNKSDEEMKVVLEEKLNLLKKAKRIVSEKGSDDYYEEGYEKVDTTIKLAVYNNDLDAIYEWLDGKGELRMGERVTTAFFYNDLSPERKATIKYISVNVIRMPFWYKYNDSFQEINNQEIINEGNIEVNPILKILKGNDSLIDISINNVRFSYEFPDTEDYVIFDCDSFNAKYENFYRNECMIIDFEKPTLFPGKNSIKINSGDCKVFVKRKDCWL